MRKGKFDEGAIVQAEKLLKLSRSLKNIVHKFTVIAIFRRIFVHVCTYLQPHRTRSLLSTLSVVRRIRDRDSRRPVLVLVASSRDSDALAVVAVAARL